jgi:hypothetical protein
MRCVTGSWLWYETCKIQRGIIARILAEILFTGENELSSGYHPSLHSVDALYVISDEGIQMTDAFVKEVGKRPINPVFCAAGKHENLSCKDYFYRLMLIAAIAGEL